MWWLFTDNLDGRLLWIVILYITLALTGLIGNIWVMFTVSSQVIGCASIHRSRQPPLKQSVQTSAYIYLILLSVVDLISFISVPLLVMDIVHSGWIFNNFMCKVLFLCEGMNKSLSPLILTALSVDRFLAVCHPTIVWMRQTKFALLTSCVCFAVSLVFVLPIVANAAVAEMPNQLGDMHRKCTIAMNWSKMFDHLHVLSCYLVPLIIICSVYIAILRRLYRHTRMSTVGRKTSISLSRVVRCSVMVVAFYFICWTPYWMLRFFDYEGGEEEEEIPLDLEALKAEAAERDKEPMHPPAMSGRIIVFMYILHALPYAQSAFNWLFYAFLNRNLRQSGCRGSQTNRSTVPTSTVVDNNNHSANTTPLWKNIQHMGSQLRSAGVDTSQALLKRSPFRSRSRIQSRSNTYLGSPTNGNHVCTSLLDISERRATNPTIHVKEHAGNQLEVPLSASVKCVSFTDLPRTDTPQDDSNEDTRTIDTQATALKESNSIEWL